jgi:hypothetical protein
VGAEQAIRVDHDSAHHAAALASVMTLATDTIQATTVRAAGPGSGSVVPSNFRHSARVVQG